ncbi:MAG TPA: hypothetical protein VMY98_02385 [Anaerolineae bacterium]|nr:hypothetical protein [Anaerolineae bacterium]
MFLVLFLVLTSAMGVYVLCAVTAAKVMGAIDSAVDIAPARSEVIVKEPVVAELRVPRAAVTTH